MAVASLMWLVRALPAHYIEYLNHNGDPVDDIPSIHQVFDQCSNDGTVIFSNYTFNINSILNNINLVNCDVWLRGEFRFCDDISY